MKPVSFNSLEFDVRTYTTQVPSILNAPLKVLAATENPPKVSKYYASSHADIGQSTC